MNHLYLAAKAPLAGQVKTRLGASIGMPAAAALYSAFLHDLAERFAGARVLAGWCIAPGSRRHLRPFIGPAAVVRVQRGEGWAARQANLFRECAQDGEERVVLAATDSPQLSPARIEAAFRALDTHDTVLGPTYDGGYYLVGMRGFHDLLEGVAMSTDSALQQLCRRAAAQGLTTALLAPEFDVDTEHDLARLAAEVGRRDDLAHTAAALALVGATGAESRIA